LPKTYLFISFAPPKEPSRNKHDFRINFNIASSPKANEPKKKRPEPSRRRARRSQMPTSAKTGACYTGHNGATVLAAVRTISGLPSHLRIENFA